MPSIRKILYPTDFSERSLAAVPLAVDLAQRFGAELHCLHVVDTEFEYFLRGGYVAPMQVDPVNSQQLREVACRHMEDFVAQHFPDSGSWVHQVVVLGKPFEQIIRHARQEEIDLIVIGTHGHSALGSMLLGSVAEKVIRKAPAPCSASDIRSTSSSAP